MPNPWAGEVAVVLDGQGLVPDVEGLALPADRCPGTLDDFQLHVEQLRAILRRLGVAQLSTLAVHGLNLPEHLAWATQGPGAELLASELERSAPADRFATALAADPLPVEPGRLLE